MTDMLDELFKIYTPPVVPPHPGYRVYYNPETGAVICFSQEDLPGVFVKVERELYETYRPDWFIVKDGVCVRREVINVNKNQFLPGDQVYSVKNNIQLPVDSAYSNETQGWSRRG